ncbi:MAG: ABC transporter permease [Roseiarcus sp.]|uniref:ABC transporter permease n=1 Tax=Roseiarcus sp. TaxID=1969460 RepID=UPI003C1C1D3F
MSDQNASNARRSGAGLNLLLGLTLLLLLMAMWFALSIETTTFWTSNNMANLLRQGAMIAILAIGETFVIITGGIDLSVGAVAGVISMAVAWLLTHDLGFASSIAGAISISLVIGVFIGLFHAFGVVQMGLPPFIMTLATMYALRGIGLLITNGATISITNDSFTGFSRASFLGFPWTDGSWFAVPMLFWMVIVVAVPAYLLLSQSRWGRYLFAIGSNKEAARLSGVNVKAVTYMAYIVSAFCAAFVGILLAMRIGIGNPTQGDGWELQAIASSVIGGTSLFGAVGSVHGPILTTINNGANLLNLNPFWQRIITGLLIILVVYFDTLRTRKR